MDVRWYLAYSLSYRDIEEMMEERGISVDHATINRWVVKHALLCSRIILEENINDKPV